MSASISYSSISKVFDSWELARQKYSNDEKLGMEILLNLFDNEPETKKVFGLQTDKDFRNDPILRMGITYHGLRVSAKLDSIISLLGPDIEVFEEILSTLGERHIGYGVHKDFIRHMPKAVCDSMASILGRRWNDDLKNAWTEVLDHMVQAMLVTM